MPRRGPKPKPKPKPTPGGAAWEGFTPPEALADDARAEFHRLARALEAAGTLARTDPRLVLAAARVGALLERAAAELESEGLTVVAPNGVVMRNPLLATLNTLTMRLRGLWADMGLTPATSKRGDAPASTAPADDKWAFLNLHTG